MLLYVDELGRPSCPCVMELMAVPQHWCFQHYVSCHESTPPLPSGLMGVVMAGVQNAFANVAAPLEGPSTVGLLLP